jgi:hypothetical protein
MTSFSSGKNQLKVVQGFDAKRWINEQLSRPPLLNLTAENDVDFRRRQRTGFSKEEAHDISSSTQRRTSP